MFSINFSGGPTSAHQLAPSGEGSDPRILRCAARKKRINFCRQFMPTEMTQLLQARQRAECNTMFRAKPTTKEAVYPLIELFGRSRPKSRNCLRRRPENMVMRTKARKDSLQADCFSRRRIPNIRTSISLRLPLQRHQPRKRHRCPCPVSQKPPHAPRNCMREEGQSVLGIFGRREALGPLGDPQLYFESELVARSFQVGNQSH